MEKTKIIAVYGSLKQGQYNYDRFKQYYPSINVIKKDTIKGFKMFSLGPYPAVVKSNNGNIAIQLLEVPTEAYDSIKRMELGAGYNEIDVQVKGINAKMYIFNREEEQMIKQFKEVENGIW